MSGVLGISGLLSLWFGTFSGIFSFGVSGFLLVFGIVGILLVLE
ncbi:hypothetical protein MSB_A0120 [Mycoplasma leachii PG50]|uniref:Uncharacterized protein n=1 Tax=Mycoplasma leachii (strain DSM 21131 / NCTC 10133 / N29 / PG50) TaxID=880447 RepID=E4PT91_MYCLG|nr:hypothetical protein MSB_A0120 [Mycoplasma leachii PG50]